MKLVFLFLLFSITAFSQNPPIYIFDMDLAAGRYAPSANMVNSSMIRDTTIKEQDIKDGAITSAKLAPGTVPTSYAGIYTLGNVVLGTQYVIPIGATMANNNYRVLWGIESNGVVVNFVVTAKTTTSFTLTALTLLAQTVKINWDVKQL